jgi:signal transduction histidine kinase
MNPAPRSVPSGRTLGGSSHATRFLDRLDEDQESLGVLRLGCGFALGFTLIYLIWLIASRGFYTAGIGYVWLALGELTVFLACMWSSPILRIWRIWTLCFGILLIVTFSLFGAAENDSALPFVSCLLCSLATAAYVAWGWRWQLAMNTASLTSFLAVPWLTDNVSHNRASQSLGLLIALAFAQSGAYFLDRYRQRIRRQLVALEEAARFREAQIATMVHDVRSPLAALNGYGSLLESEDMAFGERSEVLARLSATLWSIDLVISNLLDLYQLQGHNLLASPAELDPNALIADVVENCAKQAERRSIALKCDLERLPRCRQDPRHLERIVRNLIGFSMGRVNSGTVQIKCGENYGRIAIEVVDDGPPLSDSELRALLSPEPNGATSRAVGLGLYIARVMTESAGGKLEVRRVAPERIALVVELPTEAPAATPARSA